MQIMCAMNRFHAQCRGRAFFGNKGILQATCAGFGNARTHVSETPGRTRIERGTRNPSHHFTSILKPSRRARSWCLAEKCALATSAPKVCRPNPDRARAFSVLVFVRSRDVSPKSAPLQPSRAHFSSSALATCVFSPGRIRFCAYVEHRHEKATPGRRDVRPGSGFARTSGMRPGSDFARPAWLELGLTPGTG